MNSSKVILDKIINDSNAIINDNLSKANAQADEIIAKETALQEERIKQFEGGLKASYDEIIRRSVVVSNLDAKKITMDARAKAIDNLFEKAKEKLVNLDKKKYLAIVQSLIAKYAEDGDSVIISAVDKDRITQKFIDDTAKKLAIKLTLSKEVGNFNGGLVLAGKNSDKNLTFDMELQSIREECETQIANMLFEG